MRTTKKILLVLFLTIAVLAYAIPGVYRKTLTLAWDFPPDVDTNVIVHIYGSASASIPMTEWQWRTNVAWPVSNVTLPITPGRQFFVATCSNYWGESDFSNVATAPGLPPKDINLHVAP